jgi:benzoylformate decarboxylase
MGILTAARAVIVARGVAATLARRAKYIAVVTGHLSTGLSGVHNRSSAMPDTVRIAFIKQLRLFGMTSVFGNPGSPEPPMFRDFPEDFRYVLGLQESVVVAMADGYAQATGNAAMVNLHSPAGVGHAMGNIFTAWRNRTPLVITAELPLPYLKWSCEPARA